MDTLERRASKKVCVVFSVGVEGKGSRRLGRNRSFAHAMRLLSAAKECMPTTFESDKSGRAG